MPASSKSSVRETPRPVNVFYVWYSEVCRRLNTTPLSIVKPAKPKNSTVLDFVCDRIKPEEWTPVLNALGKDTSLHVIAIRSRAPCKFMPEIDTEDKVRSMKRRYGCLYTAYILRALIKSICSVLKKSQVLASLELDGLPVTVQYIETLLIHLRKNNTLRVLSLQHCPLRDIGCQQLCLALRFMPNIEVLNLSGCDLTSISGEYIAKLIKYQQINRYCESWHNSLRYEEPEVGNMRGLKRITLNNNPNIGDDGLVFIIDELDDDLWIKALDMQKCGITEKLSGRLLDLVDYSRSLEIADFRHNEGLSDATVEKILEILSRKQNLEDTEFHWCLTASSLCYDQCRGMTSAKSCNSTSVQQSKSAPFQPILPSCSKPSLRRTKTAISMNKRPFEKSYNNISISQAKKECVALNDKLKREIAKRQEMEKANEELHQKLDTITSLATLNATKEQNPEKSTEADEIKNEALLPPKPMPQVIIKAKNGFVRKKEKEGKDAEHAKSISKAPNGLNGFKHPPGKAQDIFEGLLYKDGMCEEGDDVDIQEFYELACNLKSKSKVALYLDTTNEQTLDELSVSSISLQKLIEEMEEEDDGNLEANLDSAGRTSTTKRTVSKPSTWKCKSTNGIIVR